MKNNSVIISFFLSLSIFTSCNVDDVKEQHLSFKWSRYTDSILSDTIHKSIVYDSIREFVHNSKIDTIAIDALNELSTNDKKSSDKRLAHEALRHSIELNYKPGIADALYRIGSLFRRQNNYDSAFFYLDSSISYAHRNLLFKQEALAYTGKGDAFRFIGMPDTSNLFFRKSLFISRKANENKIRALSYFGIGDNYNRLDSLELAKIYLDSALALFTEINEKYYVAITERSFGENLRYQNQLPEAIVHYANALRMAKDLKEKNLVAIFMNSIAEIYKMEEDFPRALMVFDSAIVILQDLGNKNQLAFAWSSVGEIYRMQGKYDKGRNAFITAIQIADEIHDSQRKAYCLSSLGELYANVKQYDSSDIALKDALKIATEINDLSRQSFCYAMLARNQNERGHTVEAIKLGEEALRFAEASHVPFNEKNASEVLYLIYDGAGQKGKAFTMFRKFIMLKDSLTNEDQIRKIAQAEFSAKEDQLKAEEAVKDAQYEANELKQKNEIEKQRNQRNLFIAGAVLLFALTFFIYRNLRQSRQAEKIIFAQKTEVENQKHIVEEKNKEILDSITYAKRLQDAILPPSRLWNEMLPDSFVLYLPKDIVAGDFYWMETVKKDDVISKLFFAAADCTGHGVPGAMVSVVCSNALNRAVKEFHLDDPGQILNKVRELVLQTFEKSESVVNDGMDIALISIDKQTGEIKFSGAHNPAWICSGGKISEVKPDKMPIGEFEHAKSFTTQILEVKHGDMLYLFTDGYADQFGGPQGKKFKYKQLQSLLESNSALSPDSQKETLHNKILDWKGELEQVDDICIIGVRI